jgi:hypothetical protein
VTALGTTQAAAGEKFVDPRQTKTLLSLAEWRLFLFRVTFRSEVRHHYHLLTSLSELYLPRLAAEVKKNPGRFVCMLICSSGKKLVLKAPTPIEAALTLHNLSPPTHPSRSWPHSLWARRINNYGTRPASCKAVRALISDSPRDETLSKLLSK